MSTTAALLHAAKDLEAKGRSSWTGYELARRVSERENRALMSYGRVYSTIRQMCWDGMLEAFTDEHARSQIRYRFPTHSPVSEPSRQRRRWRRNNLEGQPDTT